MDFSDLRAAIRSLYTETTTQKQGVMTDVGPGNAKAYSAILAGREPPDESAKPKYENIKPPPPASSLPGVTPEIAPGALSESIIAGAHASLPTHLPTTHETEPHVPGYLEDLNDSELRSLVNQMHGKRGGQKGSVGTRTKRPKLLQMAANVLGLGRKLKPQAATEEPPKPLSFTQSEVAASGPVDLPSYDSILAASHGSGESQVAAATSGAGVSSAMAAATERIAGTVPTPQGPVAPLPPSLVSQADTGATAGPGGSSFATKPTTSGASFATPPLTTSQTSSKPTPAWQAHALQTTSQTATAGPGPRLLNPITTSPPKLPGFVHGQVATPGQSLPQPQAPVVAQAMDEKPSRLAEAMQRLTAAVDEANRKERSVAEETRGLSLGERFERLEKSGDLLDEDEVKRHTGKDTVSKQDVVNESERQEQRRRDKRREGRKNAVEEASDNLADHVGGKVGNVVERITGSKTLGSLAGRGARAVARETAAQLAGKAASKGLLGAAGRLGRLVATNPYTGLAAAAVAAGAALVKMPSIVERLSGSMVEGQRHLAKYNASLAATYARLDYQKRLLEMQQAAHTSGSTAYLGRQFGALRGDIQEFKEMGATVTNLWMTGVVQITRGATYVVKMFPLVKRLVELQEMIEKILGANSTGNTAIIEHLQGMSTYSPYTSQPKNKKPKGEDDGKNKNGGI